MEFTPLRAIFACNHHQIAIPANFVRTSSHDNAILSSKTSLSPLTIRLSNFSTPVPRIICHGAVQRVQRKAAKQDQKRYKDVNAGRYGEKGENFGSFGSDKVVKHSGGRQRIGGSKSRGSKKFAPWVRSDHVKEKSVMEKKKSSKVKLSGPEGELRGKFDMCSKLGDFMGGIALYDKCVEECIQLEQYHYNVLLYLCASAATGVVQSAKSGSNGSSLGNVEECDDNESNVVHFDSLNVKKGDTIDEKQRTSVPIHSSEGVRDFARKKGFEIFKRMRMEKVTINEASFTSVARMAVSTGDGDMAFEIVKQMKDLGITPRLRSYGPALLAYCNGGYAEKAFEVEAHMLECGVYPEELELEALLRASVSAGRGDKVYYLLHKFRTKVRQVSPSVAELIETWFKSSAASRFGKRKWDANMVAETMENGGGGWHGLGWLGKGKWKVAHTHVNVDGQCMSCAEKLVTIDLDPIETENFANSVASLASKRERNASFQKFQKWLDYFGPFEAVIDAANVGLFSQGKFSISKVNGVANSINQKLSMMRWPLIIVHNKRLSEFETNKTLNTKILEKWKNADAIYATPTGSNDDWYWLYAAIKCKCLIVTNDEMRDHLFQTLGNDFFPRWKERHQVHFAFQDGGFEFQMPPPYSVVIQETEKGHWHIPISLEYEKETKRSWLCVTRGDLHKTTESNSNMVYSS